MLSTKPNPYATLAPPSSRWIVAATLVVVFVYSLLWLTTEPPSSSSSLANPLANQDRSLLQIETLVGQLVQFNPLQHRSQLQGVVDALDRWERHARLQTYTEATQEPRELLQQLSTQLRKQNGLVHDLIGVLQQLKAEYQHVRLTAPPVLVAAESPSIILTI